MRYASFFQPLNHAQQLTPEAFQEVEREPAFLANAIRESVCTALVLGAGHGHEERFVAGQLDVAEEPDDVRMAERVQ